MADQGGIKAGRAWVELGLNDSTFQRGLENASKKLKSWGKGITTLGAQVFAVGALLRAPFELAAHTFAGMGAELTGMAARTGVSVEQLSALSFAAAQSGVDMEGLEHGIRHMEKGLYEAANGSKEAQAAFTALGFSAQELGQMTPDDRMVQLGTHIAELKNPAERAALAMKIFGREGTQLLPFFARGVDGINDLLKKAQELGLVMSAEDAAAARDFNREVKTLGAQLRVLGFTVGAAVVPAMRQFIDQAGPIISRVIDWTKENKGLVVSAFKLTGVILGTGAGLMVLGKGLSVAGIGLRLVSKLAPLAGIGLDLAGTAASLLLNPVGLAAAAVAGIGYALYKTGAAGAAIDAIKDRFPGIADAGQRALDFLSVKWDQLKSTAITTWGGIQDAVSAGDLGAAAGIAWAGIKLAWMEGTEEVMGVWDDAVAYVESAWADTSAWLQTQFVTVRIYWSELTAFFSEEWDRLTAYLSEVWRDWEPTVTAVLDTLKSQWQAVTGFLRSTWDNVIGALSAAWDRWGDKVMSVLKPVLTAMAYVNPAAAAALAAMDKFENNATVKNLGAHLGAAGERASGEEGQQARDEIEQERQQKQEEIAGDPDRKRADRRAAIEAARQDLLDKRKGAADALAESRRPRVPGGAADTPIPDFESVKKKVDVTGTFSARAAGMMGGGDRGDPATRETAQNTKNMIQLLQQLIGVTAALEQGFLLG